MSKFNEPRYLIEELTEDELKEMRNGKNALLNELAAVGEQFDCWFTIERASTPTSKTLQSARFKIDYDVESIDALREVMQTQLEGAVIRKNSRHPRVLHVIDAALAKDANYAMDKPATLEYSGIVGGLPTRIGEVVPGIRLPRSFSNTEGLGDHVTQVDVDAKEESVRDILTNAVPIERYEPVLWVAETHEQDGKRESWIRFIGPRDQAEAKE